MAVWAKVETSIRDHPKSATAGPQAMWHFICILLWCKERETDGRIPMITATRVSTCARPASLIKKLIQVGFLEDQGEYLIVHDWFDYQESNTDVRVRRDKAARAQRLYSDKKLRDAIQLRDGDRCRYCGVNVKFNDRKSALGATYDHVDPDGDNSFDNVVVACRSCNAAKCDRTPSQWGRDLLPPVDNLLVVSSKDLLLEQSRAEQSRTEQNRAESASALCAPQKNDLVYLLADLEKCWPRSRCRDIDRALRESAIFNRREDLPPSIVSIAAKYIAAHGFSDDSIKGCVGLHRWITEARWLEPLPGGQASEPAIDWDQEAREVDAVNAGRT